MLRVKARTIFGLLALMCAVTLACSPSASGSNNESQSSASTSDEAAKKRFGDLATNTQSSANGTDAARNTAQPDAKATQGAPATIEDYYYLLPDEYFACCVKKDARREKVTREERRALVGVMDLKNGYTRTKNWENGVYLAVALFRKKAGGYLVGVETREQASGIEAAIHFLEYDGVAWRNATKGFLPTLDDRVARRDVMSQVRRDASLGTDNYAFGFEYLLPREGTTIAVTDNYRKQMWFELLWDGERFTPRPFKNR